MRRAIPDEELCGIVQILQFPLFL